MIRDLILFFLITVFTIGTVNAQSVGAKIVFDNEEHNFGTIKEEAGAQSFIFSFTNKGDKPLIIQWIKASCGCTTSDWTKEPVIPGAKGKIMVTYHPENRPGEFQQRLCIFSNAENGQSFIGIHGYVKPRKKTITELYPVKIGDVIAQSGRIIFPSVKKGKMQTDSLEIYNNTEKTVYLSFHATPAYIKIQVPPEKLSSHQKGYIVVTFDASKIDTYGYVMNRIYINTNNSFDFHNSLLVSANIEEDFSSLTPEELNNAPVISFDSKRFDFGNLNQQGVVSHKFIIKNTGKNNLIIRRIKTSCGCTVVTPGKKIIAPDEEVPLMVKFNPRGKDGRQIKAITVISNDPKHTTSILCILANVYSFY
ncbi:MAG: DUF1573 domain-containing protein [Prolixibacteraceae bacterium]|nr:DUF1573 domain-containing protein [Prolixibacteraceae bacterium]